jgi:hypothetical protein
MIKKVVLSSISVMFLVGILGFTPTLAAAAKGDWLDTHTADPLIINAGGIELGLTSTVVNITLPMMIPGQAVDWVVTATNTSNVPAYLNLSIDGINVIQTFDVSHGIVGSPNDLGNITTLSVWIDPSASQTEDVSNITGDALVLLPDGSMSTYGQSGLPAIPISTIKTFQTLNIKNIDIGKMTSPNAFKVHYIFSLPDGASTDAEGQTLTIATSLGLSTEN